MNQAEPRALRVARAAAIGVAIGAVLSPPLANLAAAILVIAFFFVPDWRARLRAFAGSVLGKGVLVFAAALALATIVGLFNPQSVRDVLLHLFGWRTLFLTAIAFAVFDSARWKTRLAVAFITFVSLAAVVSLVCWLIGWEYRDLGPGVILRNTVTQAMAFGIGAFLAAVLLVTRQVASTRARVLLAIALLLLLAQLVFLQTGRSGQVMAAVSFVVAAALLLRGPRRIVAVAVVPVLAVAGFSISPIMQARFLTAWQELGNAANATEYTSMGMRVVMWQNTAQLIRARPVLGYGLGGLKPAYEAYIKDRATGWKAIVTGDPHSQYLAAWVEGGLLGLLAFLFMLLTAALQPAPNPWRTVALALLAAWCATSTVSSHFQTFNEGHLIAILLGVFLAPAGADDAPPHSAASPRATAAATSS
ncbi:MAG TPA: O-antigen ligase family protein [Burkholderiaceae bacterium]|nr:O-antigen ligase family protein [Burkholderiaceae bacterium]